MSAGSRHARMQPPDHRRRFRRRRLPIAKTGHPTAAHNGTAQQFKGRSRYANTGFIVVHRAEKARLLGSSVPLFLLNGFLLCRAICRRWRGRYFGLDRIMPTVKQDFILEEQRCRGTEDSSRCAISGSYVGPAQYLGIAINRKPDRSDGFADVTANRHRELNPLAAPPFASRSGVACRRQRAGRDAVRPSGR